MSVFSIFRRIIGSTARVREDATAGPAPLSLAARTWSNGTHSGARYVEAHPARVGGDISPWAVVLHDTQTHPDDFNALVERTRDHPGRGGCCHFLIGREPGQLVQFAPIHRNANHAGGTGHGWITTTTRDAQGHAARPRRHHPNLVSVGIKLHCAGPVRLVNGRWRTVDLFEAYGRAILSGEVNEWREHRATAWQLDQLHQLLTDLEPELRPDQPDATLGTFVVEDGRAELTPMLRRKRLAVYAHRELHPASATDPAVSTMEWLAEKGW